MTQRKTHTRTTVDRGIHMMRRMAGVFAIASRVTVSRVDVYVVGQRRSCAVMKNAPAQGLRHRYNACLWTKERWQNIQSQAT